MFFNRGKPVDVSPSPDLKAFEERLASLESGQRRLVLDMEDLSARLLRFVGRENARLKARVKTDEDAPQPTNGNAVALQQGETPGDVLRRMRAR